MGPKCGSESYRPPRDKLRFPEKTLKLTQSDQDASKTAQDPAHANKSAKTLCFTGRNSLSWGGTRVRPAEGARPVGGRKRGGQNKKEDLTFLTHASYPAKDRAGGFNRSAHSAGPGLYFGFARRAVGPRAQE